MISELTKLILLLDVSLSDLNVRFHHLQAAKLN